MWSKHLRLNKHHQMQTSSHRALHYWQVYQQLAKSLKARHMQNIRCKSYCWIMASVFYYNQIVALTGKVYLEFAAPGGITSLPADARVAAIAAPNIYLFSGLAKLSSQQTEQLFQVNNTSLTPYIDNTTQGYSIETATDSLEFALSAIHASMLNGKIDANVFNNIKQNMLNWNRNNDPGFQSVIQKDLFLSNPYEGKLSLKQLYNLDEESVRWVYKALFGHANGYKLTLIGDFDQQQAKVLIEKYLGSLPKGQLHQYASKKQPFSTKKVVLQENINNAQRADLIFDFIFEATQPSIKEIYAADIMSRILNRKMYTYVREELSLSYAPTSLVWIFNTRKQLCTLPD